MAPSSYAEDFINGVPIGTSSAYAVPEKKSKSKAKSKVNRKVEVLPEAKAPALSLSRGNLLRAICCLCLVGAFLIVTVWMTARATDIKYSINQMNKKNVMLEDEITALKIKITKANSIEFIEDFATGELGMVYPKSSQTIYLVKDEVRQENLAETIREKAYNK